jgi:hypothetical protein
MKTKQISYEDVPEQIRSEARKYPAFKMGTDFCEAMEVEYTPSFRTQRSLKIPQNIRVKGNVVREDYLYFTAGSSGYPNTNYDNREVSPPMPVRFSVDRSYETPFFWKFDIFDNSTLIFGLLMYKEKSEGGNYFDKLADKCKYKRTIAVSKRNSGIPILGERGCEDVYAYVRMRKNLGSLTNDQREQAKEMTRVELESYGVEDLVNVSIGGRSEKSILDLTLRSGDLAKQLGDYGQFELQPSQYQRRYLAEARSDEVGSLVVKIESHTPIFLAGIKLSQENERRLESIAKAFGEIAKG